MYNKGQQALARRGVNDSRVSFWRLMREANVTLRLHDCNSLLNQIV